MSTIDKKAGYKITNEPYEPVSLFGDTPSGDDVSDCTVTFVEGTDSDITSGSTLSVLFGKLLYFIRHGVAKLTGNLVDVDKSVAYSGGIKSLSIAKNGNTQLISAEIDDTTTGQTEQFSDGFYTVPSGGTTGQVLKKNSATNGDYSWGQDGGLPELPNDEGVYYIRGNVHRNEELNKETIWTDRINYVHVNPYLRYTENPNNINQDDLYNVYSEKNDSERGWGLYFAVRKDTGNHYYLDITNLSEEEPDYVNKVTFEYWTDDDAITMDNPLYSTEILDLGYVTFIFGVSAIEIPAGGTISIGFTMGEAQIYTAYTYDVAKINIIPSNGTEGQVLTKTSNGEKWANITRLPSTAGHSTGDVLGLDSNLSPIWSTPSEPKHQMSVYDGMTFLSNIDLNNTPTTWTFDNTLPEDNNNYDDKHCRVCIRFRDISVSDDGGTNWYAVVDQNGNPIQNNVFQMNLDSKLKGVDVGGNHKYQFWNEWFSSGVVEPGLVDLANGDSNTTISLSGKYENNNVWHDISFSIGFRFNMKTDVPGSTVIEITGCAISGSTYKFKANIGCAFLLENIS